MIWRNFNSKSVDIDDEYLAYFKHIGNWVVFISIGCKVVQCVLLFLMNSTKRRCAYFMVAEDKVHLQNVDEEDYLVSDYE